MQVNEFVAFVVDYYGAFDNEAVATTFARYANKVRATDLDRIYDWMLENIAANWNVDVKTLIDACRALQVPMLKPVKQCVCCGTTFTGELCPACMYDPVSSGDVEEYRAFFADWQKNREKYVTRVAECLNPLNSAKNFS